MKNFWMHISYLFWYWIIRPFKRFWHLCINKSYIPDTERNKQVMEFCLKICHDNNYEASNPVEHWIENQWEQMYNEFVRQDIEAGRITKEQVLPFKEYRPQIASQVGLTLQEYAMVKER